MAFPAFALKRLFAVPALIGLLTAGMATAHAQSPAPSAPPLVTRGTITAFAGDSLTLRAKSGATLTVSVGPQAAIRAVAKADLSAIAPDSYIGTAAVPQADGTLKALEVHIFPASMRGTGDGHRPWDLTPDSTMTNGAVGSIVGSHGRTITVRYQTGEKTVVVPPDVPIVTLEPGDRSLLVPGAKVVLFASKAADGSLSAGAISVGRDGIAPPM